MGPFNSLRVNGLRRLTLSLEGDVMPTHSKASRAYFAALDRQKRRQSRERAAVLRPEAPIMDAIAPGPAPQDFRACRACTTGLLPAARAIVSEHDGLVTLTCGHTYREVEPVDPLRIKAGAAG
jgi:hypothetical protein